MSYVQWPSQAKPWSKWSRCMNPNCRRSCYGQMCYQCHTMFIEMATSRADSAKAKAGPSQKSKSGDSSLPSKAPSKSVPAGPPPKAAGISVQPPDSHLIRGRPEFKCYRCSRGFFARTEGHRGSEAADKGISHDVRCHQGRRFRGRSFPKIRNRSQNCEAESGVGRSKLS